MEINPILCTYRILKYSFEQERHISMVNNYKFRNAITPLWTSSHGLEIERGRHTKPKTPRHLRICKFCINHLVEDEYHFLIICPLYNELRQSFYDKISSISPSFISLTGQEKYVFLFRSQNEQIFTWLGKYIHMCFNMSV